MVFLVVMYGCESWYKEGWAPKNWSFWYCRRLLNIPWTARRLNQSILKEINPKYFIVRTDAEAPILCPPDAKNWLLWKDPDAGKDWRQEEKGVIEGEMVGWHHWLNGHECNQILENSKEQGSPWHPKESDTTYGLNNSNTKKSKYL